jgi:uncharacterized protein (DUF427 family)
MSLTLARGPLSDEAPGTVNYRLAAPGNRLLLSEFPRRVRAVFAGERVVDTVHGALLHETGRLPQLYVPQTDVAGHLLIPSDTVTLCPVKGEACYHSVVVGDREAADAVWSYPAPPAEAAWLRGYQGVAWEAMDAWFDEEEEVFGHLRDPYHRVDTRRTTGRVRVTLGSRALAESTRPVLVSETGMANRLYVPEEDVRPGALTASATTSVCPYKGTADYANAGDAADVAWRYRDPLPEAAAIAGYWCFDDTVVTTTRW